RLRRADQAYQGGDAEHAGPKAEPGGRHAELAVVGGDADVGLQGGEQATADAEAADHGDEGLVQDGPGPVQCLASAVVLGASLGGGAPGGELGDVGGRGA